MKCQVCCSPYLHNTGLVPKAAHLFNFVGHLFGPRGNSLKRVKASIEGRVLIKGRGSIKDPVQEEMMQGKPGYEHLNEPLYIFVEAELPAEIVDAHLMQAREILEDLLKPVVTYSSAPEP
ncbi:unnamed protein product [Camellia sinensis]